MIHHAQFLNVNLDHFYYLILILMNLTIYRYIAYRVRRTVYRLFFRITATQYLTALALVQDYRRHLHLAYPSPPPHAHVIYIYSRPIVTTCLYSSALLVAELGSCLHP